MKRKIIAILLSSIVALSLIACNNTSKTESKSDTVASENKSESDSQEKKDDIWTYFEGSTWNENYEGLNQQIEKVVITDKAPATDGSDNKTSAVGIKFKLDNTTKEKFTTYPDQAVLVTSTGEQIQMPAMFLSDHLGGEIDEGVKKEGNIIWELKNKGTAKDITWIKLKWDTRKGAEDNFDANPKTNEIKLELKK